MELITYLLKVSACTVLFFAFYLLVLRRLTFFKTNRFYLLFTLLLSFIIPTLNFTIEREVVATEIIDEQATIINNELPVTQFQVPNQVEYTPIVEEESFDWYSILPYFYFGIVACLLINATWRILQLLKHIKNGSDKINGLKIVPKTSGFTNCSFFNYVFIDNENLSEAELHVLLKHEQIHAKQLHSIDKIVLIIAKAFLWFNPVVYVYDKALEQAHEYEADEATSQSFGKEQYANLLLRLAIVKSEMPLVHNFVKSPIKERIKMLFNSKSKHMKKLLYLLALPVGMGLLWGFTVDVVDVVPKNVDRIVIQNQPFIQRTNSQTDKGYKSEQITLNTINGKPNTIKIVYSGAEYQKAEVWVYIDDKLYSEEDAQKFDKNFIAKLSEKRGYGSSKNYSLSAMNVNKLAYIFWFGNEPKPSDYMTKNKAYWGKYNGKTIEGQIVELTYSPTTKVMDGFLIKTANGETLKANVEAKFAEQTKAMISTGDKVNVKIYNANYWKDTAYPVLTSYKISKGGKLLYDRWPKTASNKISVSNEAVIIPQIQSFNKLTEPTLLSSRRLRVDNKTDMVYITGGRMLIGKNIVEAENMVWDRRNGLLTAESATIKYENREVISGENLEYDFKKGTSKMIRPFKYVPKDELPSKAYQLISKLEFNTDSIKKSDVFGLLFLRGNVKLNLDNYSLNAKIVNVERGSNIITSYLGSIKSPDGLIINADVIEFDVITKKITTDKKLP